eukprot:GILK01003146.1.p1 GENE.GILK01003146.1~~GILK01003146.1.p1  ORF type:complete len:495 (-),score=157.88 GILK01003146.1:117-1601(-)
MPPKKKPSGGKKEKGKTKQPKSQMAAEKAVHQTEAEQLSQRRRLLREARDLKTQYEAEIKLRNQCQEERDKVSYFWTIEKKTLEEKSLDLRNRERERQDLEERHQIEINLYKQKVKHLLFEQQSQVSDHKYENEVGLKMLEDEYRDREAELKKDVRSLKVAQKQAELSHDDYLKSLKHEHDKKIVELRQEFERSSKEVHLKNDQKMREMREQCDAQRKLETQRIEKLKNDHIHEIMQQHQKALTEIKNYYHDIVHNNLDLIKTLKEEKNEKKKQQRLDELQLIKIQEENKKIVDPLKAALAEVDKMKREYESYVSDKKELVETKAKVLLKEEDSKTLLWEIEVLTQQFERTQTERDELYKQLQHALLQVQAKAGFKNLVLERKITTLDEDIEKKDTQLRELVLATKLEPTTRAEVQRTVDNLITGKNRSIDNLQTSINQVAKAHDEMIHMYYSKMSEYGIPPEELGFQPLLTKPTDDLYSPSLPAAYAAQDVGV